VPSNSHTIIYEKDGVQYKLCKLLFARDGSYSVLSPYHPAQKAILMKATVNYSMSKMEIAFEEAIDLAAADDEGKRLKLSHHRSGFLQFSGQGILSGLDADGKPKGMGIMSWPLETPIEGPAFGMVLFGVEQFEQANRIKDEACTFRHNELTLPPSTDRLALEGYYFPPLWRRFVRTQPNGERTISVVHPARPILRLKTVFPADDCELQGFFGLELYGLLGESQTQVDSGYILSSSTGNVRRSTEGHLLGDGLFCMYPRQKIVARRSLDYTLGSEPPTLRNEDAQQE
jgi:hypothetical protein